MSIYNYCNYNANGTFVCKNITENKNIIEPFSGWCSKCLSKDFNCYNLCRAVGNFSQSCNNCRNDASKCTCK